MLRRALLCFATLLIVLGVVLARAGGLPGGWFAIAAGGFLLLALAIERAGYKRVENHPPGPDWQPTGERFREPGSDTQVAVYYHPKTGRRVYVRIG